MSPDTIHFKQERIYNGNHDKKLWHVRTNALEGEARAPGITASHHKIRGLRLKGHNHTFTTVEVPSLPYLLYGHNAATIHGISEIRLAYQLLDEILSEIAPQKGTGNLISSYSRLDAAFQFRYPTKQLFSLLQQYQFPGSRTPVKVFLGKSIRFDYKGL